MIICNYWDYLIANNHRIKYILFDDYVIANNRQIIPIIQSKKKKCEYPVHILQIIRHIIFDNYLTYLMIIWWLFDDYLTYLMIIWKTWTRTQFRFRRAMLPQNPGGQTCTISEYCSSVVRGRGCDGGDSVSMEQGMWGDRDGVVLARERASVCHTPPYARMRARTHTRMFESVSVCTSARSQADHDTMERRRTDAAPETRYCILNTRIAVCLVGLLRIRLIRRQFVNLTRK